MVRCLPFLITVHMFSSRFFNSFAADIMTSHKNYTKIVFKLYFFNEKRLLVVFLVMVRSFLLFSQEGTY